MFERANAILKDAKIPEGIFELQFAVYRNYNSPEQKILQYSTWETKPENLEKFMGPIEVDGGWGNEAIEIGLWHANREAAKKPISVLLIGDAPANTEQEVEDKRNDKKNNGGIDWSKNTLFAVKTHYKAELAQLQAKKVNIYAFYVDKRAKENFEEIAGKDRTKFLDVNSAAGSELLTEVVTKQVLSGAASSEAQKNEFLKEYDKRFQKSHLS